MTLTILFSAPPASWDSYATPIRDACAAEGLDVRLLRAPAPDLDPARVDYIVFAPNGPIRDFSPFTRCKAVMSLWAGVETVVDNPTLSQPLTRMVEDGLTTGMSEWVAGHVLRHHLGTDLDVLRAPGDWSPHIPPLARERPVTILGLGALGQAAARMLCNIGFPVTGWSRSRKEVPGVRCLAGEEALPLALSEAQILILLLPDTPATENILNAETLAMLPRGAVVLNPGRGTLIDDEALLAALDNGHIAHATLDVFRVEPLPREHPFWRHPKVTVTPHIAAETRPNTAAQTIAENIRRGEEGKSFLHEVDRERGY
jgi:glyoxylate/hydroxypyruvate reductase A